MRDNKNVSMCTDILRFRVRTGFKMDTLDRAPDMPPDTRPVSMEIEPLQYGPRDVFTVEHRGIYNKLVLYAADETEPREKRNMKRSNAALKLKRATTKFLETSKLNELDPVQRAETVHGNAGCPCQDIKMDTLDRAPDVPQPAAVQYGPPDVFTVEHRGIYNEWVLYAADETEPRYERRMKRSNAALKLKRATTKFIQTSKLNELDPVQRAETEAKTKADREAYLNTPIYITEEFDGIGPRDVFSIKGRGEYNALVTAATDTNLSEENRISRRSTTAVKLKKAVSTFREAERLETLHAEQRASVLTARVYASYEVFHVECDGELIAHGPRDVFSVEERGVYNAMVEYAADVSMHPMKRNDKRGNAAKKLKYALQKINREDAIAALDSIVAVDERDAALQRIFEDDRLFHEKRRATNAKFQEKERNLRLIGDQGAISRRDKKKLTKKDESRKQRAAARQESDAKNRAWFKEHGLDTTTFDPDPEIRKEQIDDLVRRIFTNPVGTHCLSENTGRWEHDHGPISFQDLLLLGNHMIYILYTMTDCNPGEEDACPETRKWLIETDRDPLMRIKCGDRDLKRCTTPQARSIVQAHVLSQFDSAYDATSVEGSCQHYLEEVLQLPHGMVLNRKAGAGSRRENSLTKNEIARIKRGNTIIYTVAVALIKATDLVFAEADPDPDASDSDPDEDSDSHRGPPLVSATVLTHDGIGKSFNVSIQGMSGGFPGTPSVLADRATNKCHKERDNARHRESTLKRKADNIET
jgi:hypothetical protein